MATKRISKVRARRSDGRKDVDADADVMHDEADAKETCQGGSEEERKKKKTKKRARRR